MKVSVQVTVTVLFHSGIADVDELTVTFIVSHVVRLCQAKVTVAVVQVLVQVDELGHSRANHFTSVQSSQLMLLNCVTTLCVQTHPE